MEDFEEPSAAGRWIVSGGPQASAGLVEDIVHFGRHALRFHVRVDWAYGDAHFPGGWRYLTFRLASPQDWSSHDALEFFVYVPAHQPDGVLKYGVQCEGATGEPAWNSVLTPYTLLPGQWSKVSCPLNDFTVKGDRTRVLGVQFYIAEGWYKDGDDLKFYLDDFALLKSVGGTRSEMIRKAGRPLAIPVAYERQATPALYPVMPLEFIYPDTDLSARAPVRQCSLCAAKGEVKSLALAVVAGDNEIKNLKLTVSDLVQKDGGAGLASAIADARVVKVWEQAALHWEVFEPQDKILVPELLLKDDRTAFKGEGDEASAASAPSLLNAPFGTDIPAHTVKQLWMNFSVPEDALAGVYRGGLTLEADQGMEKRNVPLDIRVLPFVLPPPKLNYGLYYRKRLHGAPAEKDLIVPAQLMLADFREIQRAGFNGLTIVKMEDVETMLKLMKEVGMKGPVMLDVGGNPSDKVLTQAVAKARAVGLEMYVYGKDEPGNDPNLLAEQKVLSARYHSIGLKVTTAVDVRSAQRLCDAGQGLDWANLSMDADSVPYLGKLKTGNAKPVAPLMTYYWQVYQENPTLNRLCCGFYLGRAVRVARSRLSFRRTPASLPTCATPARPCTTSGPVGSPGSSVGGTCATRVRKARFPPFNGKDAAKE